MKSCLKVLMGIAVLLLTGGCSGLLAVRMPDEYSQKKITVDPPTYQQDDLSILENQK